MHACMHTYTHATTHNSYKYTLRRWANSHQSAIEFVKSSPAPARKTYAATIVSYYKWQMVNDHLPNFNFEKFKHLMQRASGNYKPQLHSRLPADIQIQQLRAETRRNHRNAAIIETLISTGLRAAELCALNRNQLDPHTRRAWIIGKGGKQRYVYFSPTAWQKVQKYLATRQDKDPALFLLSRKAQRITYTALLTVTDPLTPHQLRHHFATELLKSCADITIVQQALGHASPTTTQIYAQLADSKVQDAHKKAFG